MAKVVVVRSVLVNEEQIDVFWNRYLFLKVSSHFCFFLPPVSVFRLLYFAYCWRGDMC